MEYPTTNLERENLEAHVDLCAERYKQLDQRLTIIEVKVEEIKKSIADGRESMSKIIIGSTATLLSGVIGLIITIIMKF